MNSNEIFFKSIQTIKLTTYVSYREYLKDLYTKIKTDNPAYSYYQFAEDLGLSHSNVMWLVITGKRKISDKTAQKIVLASNFSKYDKKYFLLLVQNNNATRPDLREQIFQEMIDVKKNLVEFETPDSSETLEYFSEWYHPVIREMTALKEFQSDPDWISAKLCVKVAPKHIKRSLELLENLNLIVWEPKLNRHVHTNIQVLPDRQSKQLALLRYHQKMCEIAKDSLVSVPAKRRDFNALTLCLTEEAAMQASQIIYKAIEKVMQLESETKNGDQIFQFNLQVFPFLKNEERQ